MNSFVAILLCTSFVLMISGLDEEGDSCIDDDNHAGICKIITKCNTAQQSLKNKNPPKICGYKGANDVLVCCVSSSVLSTTPPYNYPANKEDNNKDKNKNTGRPEVTRISGEVSKAKCKEYAKYSYSVSRNNKRIYDCDSALDFSEGFEAFPKEFPHMVHIGYEIDNEIVYQCAGNLISESFVLTVAHCLVNKFVDPPVRVRLGITGIDDTEYRQEINIKTTFTYPDVEKFYHDVGLIELEKPASLNAYIRPACLNTERKLDYGKVFVTGWGTGTQGGDHSKILTKGIVGIVSYDKCYKYYENSRRLKKGIIDDWMVCAAIKSGKDTCQGDSGVPLQVRVTNSEDTKCMFSILGLTSFGKTCGDPSMPSVYMRVSYYIKWIEDIVWPI